MIPKYYDLELLGFFFLLFSIFLSFYYMVVMIVAEYLENNWLWAKSDANDIAFEQKRGTEFVPNHYLES